jgi:hypothetical protein
LLLPAGEALGARPEWLAPVLSAAATLGVLGLVARASDGPGVARVAPVILLAFTRSFAVWSTGGLETRMFELLVLAGALDPRRAGAWLALASLTRPEGNPLAIFILAIHRSPRRQWLTWAITVTVLAAWRWASYGALAPNTFQAKTGFDPAMGLTWLGSFLVEYSAWLWLPLLLLGVRAAPRAWWLPLLPYLLWQVAIGGDHFEYRPLDLLFPPMWLLVGRGLGALGRWGWPGLGGVVLAVTCLPTLSHVAYPDRYRPGFPGMGGVFLADVPAFPTLLGRTTAAFVGIRQEEHRMFAAIAREEGRVLAGLVSDGRLPAGTRIAIDCVGAIPYVSGLPTLDRLGLTDREVALTPSSSRLAAHRKRADPSIAVRRGVDLWAIDRVHLVFSAEDPALARLVEAWTASGREASVADIGAGKVLLAWLPRGGVGELVWRSTPG